MMCNDLVEACLGLLVLLACGCPIVNVRDLIKVREVVTGSQETAKLQTYTVFATSHVAT